MDRKLLVDLQIVSRLGWSSNNFGSGDGRGADDLFGQAVARRSSGRIPDGTPENGVHLSWGPIWLMLGFHARIVDRMDARARDTQAPCDEALTASGWGPL